jgi:hypothetical protein
MNRWEPSRVDAYLEAMRRLWGTSPAKSRRFADVVTTTDMKTDKKRDKTACYRDYTIVDATLSPENDG